MIPASGFVPPPRMGWVHPGEGKKQYVSLCRSLTTRITCIHTYTQTIHTHIHTYRQIHTYTHTCMYIQTRPPPPHPQGGRGILYIHTYILTDKYIHTPIHACTYRHAPPTHRGGGAYYTYTHTYLHTNTYIHHTLWWGGVGPADLDHIYIDMYLYRITSIPSCSLSEPRAQVRPPGRSV